VDVASREQVYAWADEVVRDHGRVNIIFNNAGVALSVTVEDVLYNDFEWIMNINFWGVVYGTKAFLPYIKAAGEGAIVNVSSVLGLIALSRHAPYNASKFAVKGFTEALRQEMAIEGNNIGVTCVHPGGVKTNIVRNARIPKSTSAKTTGFKLERETHEYEKGFRNTPEEAAQAVVHAIMKNSRRLLIGRDAVMIDVIQRLLPAQYQRILEGRDRRQRAKKNA
jgi:NAD(P)-dependent dehydrogenase (short-subunit alcohol dehydrogenase family)